MTVAALMTYYPEDDVFDEVLEGIRGSMKEAKNITPVLETRLFVNRDTGEIRSHSLWAEEKDFDDYMNFRIEQGVFNEQGRLFRREIDCQIFELESLD